MTDRRQRIHTALAESRAYLVSVAQQIGPEQTLASTENPALVAGLRISIGDDVFERSIASQLETLTAATA